MLVPVNPVCPKEFGEKRFPADEPFADFVSQPRARVLLSDWRLVNNAIVDDSR